MEHTEEEMNEKKKKSLLLSRLSFFFPRCSIVIFLAIKQKWVPLEIDIPKGKRDNSPKVKNDYGETSTLITVNENEMNMKDKHDDENDRYNNRNARNSTRGRGSRARGSRRAGFNKPTNRIPTDVEYSDYTSEFTQGNVRNTFFF